MAFEPLEIDGAHLLAARDEAAGIRDLVLCLCLACSSPHLPREERAALGELAMIARCKLDALAQSLEQMGASVTPSGDDQP